MQHLRQDSIHHSLYYTSRGALAGKKNSPKGPPCGIVLMTKRFEGCPTTKLHLAPVSCSGTDQMKKLSHDQLQSFMLCVHKGASVTNDMFTCICKVFPLINCAVYKG